MGNFKVSVRRNDTGAFRPTPILLNSHAAGDDHARADEQTEATANEDKSPLAISPEKICFIIIKAKEFDAKDEVTEPDPGSNPSDDMDVEILEEHSGRSRRRGDYVPDQLTLRGRADRPRRPGMAGSRRLFGRDWTTVREEAARAHNQRTAEYLLGTPLLGDFLEEGLSMLGYSCEEFEIGRL